MIYVILGTAMEELSMILLTVPVFFPLIVHLGVDPIWFGILIVVVVEIGLISPPVGMNLFVLNTLLPQVPTRDDVPRRAAVHGRRLRAPRDPDRLPDHLPLAAEPDAVEPSGRDEALARRTAAPLPANLPRPEFPGRSCPKTLAVLRSRRRGGWGVHSMQKADDDPEPRLRVSHVPKHIGERRDAPGR